MHESSNHRPLWRRLALVLGVWAALAVPLTGLSYLLISVGLRAKRDLPSQLPQISLAEVFRIHLSFCLTWAVLTLVIFWLARRFPFGPGKWRLSLTVHLAACLVIAFAASALCVLLNEILREDFVKPSISAQVLLFYFLAELNNNIFFYLAVLAVSQIVNYYRKYRERELRSSQLEARLAQTQLQVLKMQLHPHFLFNTLNAISALIHQDVELADRMIARLGDLLRTTLENANTQEVSLKQELDFIEPYLEIEKARLGPRLTVHLDIDPRAMDARVPNLILQPLVENAIRHGVAPRTEPGRVEIHARKEQDILHLEVRDDGPGLASGNGNKFKEGIGLANTRQRLEQLYGGGHRFELGNGHGRGLRVALAIPFREVADETEPAREEAS
jgi:two-component sensor histidine kinase